MEDVLKILVIDDDEVDRMAVQRALKKAGLETNTSEASSCASAMAILQVDQFDCVFLDFRLPDKDGLTLVREIRQAGIKTPLVILTGQGDEQIAVDLMKAGASDYLAKAQISPERLSQILRSAIRIYRAEMDAALAYQQLRASNEILLHQNLKLERQRQQIQLQNLQLLEASRLKSQFLATMSHELRTPMNSIIGFSQMLLRQRKSGLTEQQTDMTQRILSNARHLLSLINEILDFSRIESGRLELRAEAFDVAEVVEAAAAEYRSLAQEKQLKITVEIDLVNRRVVNDRTRLHQVLSSLLSNAIKFTSSGEVRIRVQSCMSNQLPESERICIAIIDTGIGIAPANLDHIFEPFRQVDQTISRRHSGAGLGLAVTHALVQMMQGKISVESQENKGSVFQVELPRQIESIYPAESTFSQRSKVQSMASTKP